MSYANMDGVPTQTAGTSELLASDWNTYVRDNFDSIKFGHIVCTSSTRPTGIAEGTMIYETDTNKVLVYSGSSWIELHDLDNTAGLPDGGAALSVVGNGTNAAAARTDLAAGTDGHILRRSGTSLGFGTINHSVNDIGLVHLDTTTFSNVSSVSVDNVFSSTYDNYCLFYRGTTISSLGNVNIRLRASGSDASTDYTYNFMFVTNTGGPSRSYAVNQSVAGMFASGNIASSGVGYVFGPNIAEETTFLGHYSKWDSNDNEHTTVGSYHNVASAYTGFTLITPAGAYGTVRTFGILNS